METYLNKLDDSWLQVESVIVYGLGRTGEKLVSHLVDYLGLNIRLIIDNNPDIVAKKKYYGIGIEQLEQVNQTFLKDNKIIVLTGAMAYESIAKSLIKKGLKENIDFCNVEQFVPEYSWKKHRKVVLCQVGSTVTTVCTLKCKDCCMFTAKVKAYKTYTIDELKRDADAFFRVVDKVLCYQILGGEVFLHKNLTQYIRYLNEQYGEKIGHIQVITNGTLIPEKEVVEALRKYNVFVRISDYSMQVDYTDTLRLLKELLDESGIQYSSLEQMKWSDIGFPERQKCWGSSDEEVHKHMMVCNRNCQQLNDQRFYFCGTFWSAVTGKLCGQEEDEYIELNELDLNNENQRKLILEYSLGNLSGKGYMNLCKICNGFGNDNSVLVDAGVQEK